MAIVHLCDRCGLSAASASGTFAADWVNDKNVPLTGQVRFTANAEFCWTCWPIVLTQLLKDNRTILQPN